MSNRETLKQSLEKNRCRITFMKLDNTERVMECTLNPALIESVSPTALQFRNTGKVPNPNTLAVFDLEKGEWRSFRVENVSTLEIIS